MSLSHSLYLCASVSLGLRARATRIYFELPGSQPWEAQFPARRREERGCGPVTGKDRVKGGAVRLAELQAAGNLECISGDTC